ncbi:hypothetical protein BDW22DRAFT_1359836 [Trametopsis cervina]|nr:hypothetical protein BDW22DRAFT_1359836 [Trametopsis cervina]
MFSFKSLAVAATLAFAAVSSVVAAPYPAQADNVLARCDCKGGLATIVTDVTASVQVHTDKLRALTAAEVTVDVVTGIVADIKGVLTGAVVDVNALVAADVDVVLATVDGTARITASALATIVANLVTEILGAVSIVLNLGGVVAINAVIGIFASLGEVLGYFLCCCFSVAAGAQLDISASVGALLGANILAVCSRLSLTILNITLSLGLKL